MIVSEQTAFTNLITEYIVLKNMDRCVIKNKKSVITIETRHIYKLSKKSHIDMYTSNEIAHDHAVIVFHNNIDPVLHWRLSDPNKQSVGYSEP
jgi:hypothetical protein